MDLDKINNTKNEIIKNLPPEELETYIKCLISNLYESFINLDKDKVLASKELIEEATSLYTNTGNNTAFIKELELRLDKANKCLIKTLEEKSKLEAILSNEMINNLFTNQIETLTYSNAILSILVASYEREPTENLLRTVKQVHGVIKMEMALTKCLLENDYLVNLEDHTERINIIQKYYSNYETLTNKIYTF